MEDRMPHPMGPTPDDGGPAGPMECAAGIGCPVRTKGHQSALDSTPGAQAGVPPPTKRRATPNACATGTHSARGCWLTPSEEAVQTRAAFDKRYPVHGVAFHVLSQVFERPTAAAPVIGYMRRGARFRATQSIRGKGCVGRWHGLPAGGFVCGSRGFLLARHPPDFAHAPAFPRLSDRLPYPYLKTVARDVPQYWRIPTVDEERAAQAALMAIARDRTTPTGLEQLEPTDAPDSGGSKQIRATHEPAEDPTESPTPEADTEKARDERLPDYVRLVMGPGFYVTEDSLDRSRAPSETGPATARKRESDFVRTVRGAYVRRDALVPGSDPRLRGHRLGSDLRLPLGMVYLKRTRTARRDPVTGGFAAAAALARFAAASLTGRSQRIGAVSHQQAADGRWIPTRALRIARARRRPPLVPRTGRWIHVDLAEQVLVAYEGDTPVFATLVSTGKPGFETPNGLFRIQAKHVSTTMDGTQGDDAYRIEDVPWTMYFQGSYALHGAFWHKRFGRVRSHGCVNLAPADARHLFAWSTPVLPSGWHGVLAQPKKHSTYVMID